MDLVLAGIMIICILAAFFGYALNIYRLATCGALTGLSLLRVIGIIVCPLGVLLGFVPNAPPPSTGAAVVTKQEGEFA